MVISWLTVLWSEGGVNVTPDQNRTTASRRGIGGAEASTYSPSTRYFVERIGVRASAAVFALVERGDLVHVGVVQLEVEDIEVLLHARRRNRLREHDVAALDVPP